jgi:predicted NBD/HSP70 family sugar kinase
MRAAPTQEEVRRQNLGVLLRHVHVLGPTSRAELTARMGLNRSTIGALTADLAGAGLVSERAPRETGKAGRPSLVVRPESNRVYVYAFSIADDRMTAARVGLGGVVLDRRDEPAGREEHEPAEAVRRLAGFVAQLRVGVGRDAVCAGAGVAVNGLVRPSEGRIRVGHRDGWGDAPFGSDLSATLGSIPVAVGNAADLAAMAEHTRGAAVGCDDLIYLHGDVGVGAGIISGGRPLVGHDGYAGEVGHMVVNPHGHPCPCGSRGCWETEIGEPALLHAAGREGSGREAVLAVVDAADRGDSVAQTALRLVGDWLGLGVANLINIFNPETVLFGGTLREVYIAAAAQVRSRLNRAALTSTREHVRLRTPQLGDNAPLLGAAELAFAHLLADPLEVAARWDPVNSSPI